MWMAQAEPSPTTGSFSLSSYYSGMRGVANGSKDNGGEQGFVFKPLGVKTASHNRLSPLANLVYVTPPFPIT